MFQRSNPILRASILRRPAAPLFGRYLLRRIILLALSIARLAGAQIDTNSIAPHRYLVLYHNATIPTDAETRIALAGSRLTRRNEHLGIAAVQSAASEDDATTLRRLAAQPNVDYVLHDRIVSAHRLRVQTLPATTNTQTTTTSTGRIPTHGPINTQSPTTPPSPPYDAYYTTPQSWAVQQVGGYGNNIPGGPAHGPWDTTMGQGIRIAIIDSASTRPIPTSPPTSPSTSPKSTSPPTRPSATTAPPRTSPATVPGPPLSPPQPSVPAPDNSSA